jgi:hypothetical protein
VITAHDRHGTIVTEQLNLKGVQMIGMRTPGGALTALCKAIAAIDPTHTNH